ncbi:MFS transporter [Streptomyces camponoticapitis]|uniref:MFS transporter n=1 Tax=Streptomyces camponoticapitis TaxID=1616125 RepID=A0ABQ2EYY5_9ACTN|nr:MFS transporter [Streptomyces camponoticapitis]GGK31807.1 MFS transporter [Streptomyces camponoticapitis]
MPAILRNKNVCLFLLGDLLANLGNYALWLAMAVWVKTLTGSTAAAGMVMFSFVLGSLSLPVFGVLADRYPRKRLLVVGYLSFAVAAFVLLLVDSPDDIWMIYAVVFANGLSGALAAPALSALLPSLVSDDHLPLVNGAHQSLHGVLRLFAPALGVGVFAVVGGPTVAAGVACSFLLATGAVLLVRPTAPTDAAGPGPTDPAESGAKRPEKFNWWEEVSGGAAFLLRNPLLRRITVATAIAVLGIGFFEVLGIEVVTKGLGRDASALGLLGVAQGVGCMVGGVTVGMLLRKFREQAIIAVAMVICALSTLALVVPLLPVVLFAVFALGLMLPALTAPTTTALQRQVPDSHLGRVFAAFEFAITMPQTVSMATGALLISHVDYRILLGVVAVMLCLAAGYVAAPARKWADGAPERTEAVETEAETAESDSRPRTALPEAR